MNTTPFIGIEIFLAIVRQGSLRSAAKSLGMGAPAVSYRLKTLERELGVNLLVRTTRSIELTDAGRALLKRAGPAFAQIDEAIAEAREAGRAKTGTLRLTLPWSAYRIAIEPVLAEFQAQYPDVRLELSFDEALVDIVGNGFHAGIRLGDRLADGMVATRLTSPLQAALSASPAYLDRHGHPQHPRDLLVHKCIRYKFISANRIADWQFSENGQTFAVDPAASLVFDSFQSVVQAAREGLGIGWSLRAVIEPDLGVGTLQTVLDAYALEHPPFFLYYPEQNRHLDLLRLFIDFMSARRSG